jgi:hypothetical protein
MAYILPDEPREPFLPRPRKDWKGFEGGTDPNGVPWVPVDGPVGWRCNGCGHSYAPWVPVCHYCPEPPAFIAKETGLQPVHIDGMTCDSPCVIPGPCGSGR